MRYPDGVFTGHLFEGMRGMGQGLTAAPLTAASLIAQPFIPATVPLPPAQDQSMPATTAVSFWQGKVGPLPMWSVVGGGVVIAGLAGFFAWKKLRKPKTTLNGRRRR